MPLGPTSDAARIRLAAIEAIHERIDMNSTMIAPELFLQDTILPVLEALDAASPDSAAKLLLGTAIQESDLLYRRQLGGGPGRGLFQMEPATHDDIWNNYLRYRRNWASKVESFLGSGTTNQVDELENNDRYAAAMARIHYMRRPEPLPDAGDLEAMAHYWKQHYNTALGQGTVDQFIAKWKSRFPAIELGKG
ncbi:MAG: hypothetical protein ACI841_002436 [Planctomycetota bacterium]|jgi:hypothetical protein